MMGLTVHRMGIGPAVVGGFSPADLSPQLWLDASDTATLFDATSGGSFPGVSGAVARWEDKSGNGYHVTQTDSARRPLVSASSGLTFDGTNDNLTRVSLPLLRNVGAGTFVVVARSDNPANQRVACTVGNNNMASNAVRGGILESITSLRMRAAGRRLDSDSFQSLDSGSNFTVAQNHLWIAIFDYSNSDLTLYRDGSQVANTTSFQTSGNTSDTDSSALSIGGFGDGTQSWGGSICECVITHSLLSGDEMTELLAYSQSKWGTP